METLNIPPSSLSMKNVCTPEDIQLRGGIAQCTNGTFHPPPLGMGWNIMEWMECNRRAHLRLSVVHNVRGHS